MEQGISPAVPAGAAMGTYAAYKASRPSLLPRKRNTSIGLALAAGLGGYAAGVGLTRIGEQLQERTGLTRPGLHAVAGSGAALLLGSSMLTKGNTSNVTRTAGLMVAGATVAGIGADLVGLQVDSPDTDPVDKAVSRAYELPLGKIMLGAAVLGIGGLAMKYGPMAAKAGKLKELTNPTQVGEVIDRASIGFTGRYFLDGVRQDLGQTAVRVYVPLKPSVTDSGAAIARKAGLDPTAAIESIDDRARLAVAALEEQGAFNKKNIVIYSPTGTGGVNPAMQAVEEVVSDGDTAALVMQYAKVPSMVALPMGKDKAGIANIKAVARRLDEVLEQRFPDGVGRPKVAIAGTSLGAHTDLKAIRELGLDEFEELGVNMHVPVGAPVRLSGWDPTTMDAADAARVVSTTNIDDIKRLTADELEGIRVLEYHHSDDPVSLLDPESALKRPSWLARTGDRPEGVPENMGYSRGVTLLQNIVDVSASINKSAKPAWKARWHDYRPELGDIVVKAFGHTDVPDARVAEAVANAAEFEGARLKTIYEALGQSQT